MSEGAESSGKEKTNEKANDVQMDVLKQQAEKYKNEYLYLRAEFDNYKKHVIKERSEMQKFASERLIVEVLGALDNFERALETKVTAENLDSFVKGVQMTATEIFGIMSRNGVTEVPSHGVAFDPAVHEAIGSEESDKVPPGYVVRVFKKAYKLHDRLIRPATVVVAKDKQS